MLVVMAHLMGWDCEFFCCCLVLGKVHASLAAVLF